MTTTRPRVTRPGVDLLDRLDPSRQHLSRFTHGGTLSLIARNARTYHRLAEEECNGPGDWVHNVPYPRAGQILDRWQADLEKRQASCEARIRDLVAELPDGYGVVFSGDPRGHCVYITTPDNRTTDWGQRGVHACD